MQHKNATQIVCTLLLFSILNTLSAQEEPDTLRKHAPKVYLDCSFCSGSDLNFIRQELTFINYVRDRKQAQVHVLLTQQETGAGGDEITVTYLGLKEFAGMNDTLSFTTSPNDTEQEIRDVGIQVIKMGLIRYVAHTALIKEIDIKYERSDDATAVEDKWKSWVFELGVSGWFNGQETYYSVNSWSSVGAKKITPEWKYEFDYDISYNDQKYELDTETIRAVSRSQYANVLIVKSISDHFSLGGVINGRSSVYNNNPFSGLISKLPVHV